MAKRDPLLTKASTDTYLGFDFGNKKIGIAVGQIITATASSTDGELGEQVKELCKQTVVENLSYPASASFGWFTDDLAKVSDTEWRYTGVIKASNEFGNKLPVRFSCSTVIDGEDMRATARFLD